MYIAPNTDLQFFQNLNIDPDYENTIYFATTQAKDAYFDNLVNQSQVILCPRCTYQRERRGYCRVEVPIGRMYDRGYMRFRNASFEGKWFYAFVDNVEYINNATTEVQYTIDVMMTWMGGYTLDQCFIERQHPRTDGIGENLVPESLDLGIKVNKEVSTSGCFTNWGYIIAMQPTKDFDPSAGRMGYYSGLHYVLMRSDSSLTTFINGLSGTEQESIVGIFKVPLSFFPNIIIGDNVNTGDPPVSYTRNLPKPVAGVTTFPGGFVPKNNKLYTYPYYHLHVKDTEGNEGDFPYELFSNPTTAQFEIRGLVGEQTQISAIPLGYKIPSQTYHGYTESLTMTDFSMVSWWTDTFKAFLSQQLISLPTNIGKVGAGAAMSAMTGNPTFFAGEALPLVSQTADALMKSAVQPVVAQGKNQTNLSMVADAIYKDFYFFVECLREDVARRIDDYFKMFGYAQNVVAQPEINVRPYYTYVKTLGCHINGSIPEDAKREIERIYDRGVRFWKESHVHIGDYTLDNSPTQGGT